MVNHRLSQAQEIAGISSIYYLLSFPMGSLMAMRNHEAYLTLVRDYRSWIAQNSSGERMVIRTEIKAI